MLQRKSNDQQLTTMCEFELVQREQMTEMPDAPGRHGLANILDLSLPLRAYAGNQVSKADQYAELSAAWRSRMEGNEGRFQMAWSTTVHGGLRRALPMYYVVYRLAAAGQVPSAVN